ncbi:MAG: MBL fold metallo-hydrolase, partial [Lachnospiraceae bacterium]|nr:MBL fold metallo-hydrolase [Lachnospiraceae bacterium]
CTTLVVPEKCFKKAQEKAGKVKKIETVMPGETLTVAGITLETVPAYNILKPFHPKSNAWVGYILNTSHGRIYVAGDTDATEELKKVQCDIALIPVGGTYTMDAKKAAEAVNIMKPKVAIPVHYGTIVGKESDADTFAGLLDLSIQVEILKEY